MERAKIKHDLLNADFSDVQSESLSHVLAEMATRHDIAELRSEMHDEFRAVRSEMASEFRAVRSEMASEFRAVRSEMASESRAVRGEMKLMEANLIGAIENSNAVLRQEIAESARNTMQTLVEFQNKLFMLMLALIGALATIFTMLDIFID